MKNLVFNQTSPGQYTLIDKFSFHHLHACYYIVLLGEITH